MSCLRSFTTLCTAWLVVFACAVRAADPPVSPEPYFKHADLQGAQLSQSGKMLAALGPVNGRKGLVAIDLATRKARVITAIGDSDIRTFHWVNDNRLVFDVWDLQSGLGEQRGGGLFGIDVDGANFRVLAPTVKALRDRGQFKATSPLLNAAKIRARVLMVYGGEDRRVPIVHGERMRDALVGNKTPVEWVAYPEEGHGFLLESNRFDFYRRVAKFPGQHLKGE